MGARGGGGTTSRGSRSTRGTRGISKGLSKGQTTLRTEKIIATTSANKRLKPDFDISTLTEQEKTDLTLKTVLGLKTELGDMKERLTAVEDEMEELRDENDMLHLELRRNNLIFYGINESESENCYEKIMNIIEKGLGLNNIEIDNTRRLGKFSQGNRPRPVHVRFVKQSHRNIIYSKENKIKLKNSEDFKHVYINADLPPRIAEVRKQERKTKLDQRKQQESMFA
jgi:hypothetical protein